MGQRKIDRGQKRRIISTEGRGVEEFIGQLERKIKILEKGL